MLILIQHHRWNLFKDCENTKAATLIIRGGAQQFVDEAERSIHDSFMIVKSATKNTAVILLQGLNFNLYFFPIIFASTESEHHMWYDYDHDVRVLISAVSRVCLCHATRKLPLITTNRLSAEAVLSRWSFPATFGSTQGPCRESSNGSSRTTPEHWKLSNKKSSSRSRMRIFAIQNFLSCVKMHHSQAAEGISLVFLQYRKKL